MAIPLKTKNRILLVVLLLFVGGVFALAFVHLASEAQNPERAAIGTSRR